jgi:hypothetical protein
MKTQDFTISLTSEQLNERLYKTFGTKVRLENYDREELEKYRNLLRTKIHQTESTARFNDLLNDENHQKDKQMLELLNTKIKEMLGEGAKVDRQAAHITKSMMKKGKSKDDAEAIAWAHIKHPKKKKKAEEGIEETNMNKTNEAKKGDGNLANNAKPYDKVTRGDVIAGRLGKDAKGGKVKEETGKFDKTSTTWTDKSGKKHPAQRVTRKTDQLSGPSDDAAEKKAKKKVKEDIFRLHVRLVNESLRYLITEDEEGKAKAITAASDMVNDYTTWMQRIGQYQTKSMIELADSIRGEFGQAESEAFKNAVAPALAASLETLTTQREAISHAVAVLAGEATDTATMGMDPNAGMDQGMEPGMDVDTGAEVPGEVAPDTMNAGDGLDASDAASGGRLTRESRQFAKIRKIAESHSIMSKLAR